MRCILRVVTSRHIVWWLVNLSHTPWLQFSEVKIFLSLPNEIHLLGRFELTCSLTTRTSCKTHRPIADPLITAEVEIFLSFSNDMQFSGRQLCLQVKLTQLVNSYNSYTQFKDLYQMDSIESGIFNMSFTWNTLRGKGRGGCTLWKLGWGALFSYLKHFISQTKINYFSYPIQMWPHSWYPISDQNDLKTDPLVRYISIKLK